MTDSELADAVRLPAAGVGIEVEPLLLDRITTEAALQPGALPLVQHTMAELFDRRQSNVIGLTAFEEAGGLAGAIGRRAEAIYVGFDGQRREATRRVFLRLVTVSEDRGDTRRRVRRPELEQLGIGADDLQAVLDEYGRHRLLTFDRDPTSRTPTVEVAHESLLTEWERFAGWVDDARDDLLTRRRLESAAHDWMSSGSDPSFLYGGGRLEVAESWAAGSGFELTDDEQRFLATSREKVDRDQVVRTRRRRHRRLARRGTGRRARGRRRRLRATQQRRTRGEPGRHCPLETQRRGRRGRSRANTLSPPTLAEARRIGTQALVEDDYDQALLLAVEGRHLEDSPETRQNLLSTIQRSPDAIAVIRSETEAFLDLGLTPDGTTLVASGFGVPATVSKYDIATRQREASITGANQVFSAVSPDGRLAVMSSFTGDLGSRAFELHIVDMATFSVIGTLSGLVEAPPTRLSFSPDGRYIAAVTDSDQSGAGVIDPIALVWDVAKGGGPIVQYRILSAELPARHRRPPRLEADPRGGRRRHRDRRHRLREKVGQIDGAHPPIAISPDGRTLAAATDASQGAVIGLFDPTSGERTAVWPGIGNASSVWPSARTGPSWHRGAMTAW